MLLLMGWVLKSIMNVTVVPEVGLVICSFVRGVDCFLPRAVLGHVLLVVFLIGLRGFGLANTAVLF